MRIGITVGTRPEIIKMAPVVRSCEATGTPYVLIHTGQHYDYALDGLFFAELDLPTPDYNLGVGSGPSAAQLGRIMAGVDAVIAERAIDMMLVQGDTNSALGGAIAANKAGIPVGHVEAGLRSYDRNMPEEINRILIDHLADALFAPTEASATTLRGEGIPDARIVVTGNTVVDELQRQVSAADVGEIMDRRGLFTDGYFIATVHRAENVDDPVRLASILGGLHLVAASAGVPVLLPLHPRTAQRIADLAIGVSDGVHILPPIGYREMLGLVSQAAVVLTDSGGLQEEACILRVPCVTLRDTTERPESVEVGANVLAGWDPSAILEHARMMMSRTRDWPNPFGDGQSGRAIVEWLLGEKRSGAPLLAARPRREFAVPRARVIAPDVLGAIDALVAVPAVVHGPVVTEFVVDGGADRSTTDADPGAQVVVHVVPREDARVAAQVDRSAG